MPELPEVEAVRLSLIPLVDGRRVTSTKQHWHRTTAPQTPALFEKLIVGQTLGAIHRIGKYLLLDTQNGDRLMIHLRMTGQVLGISDQAEVLRHERLRLNLDDGTALAFVDQRKFGRLHLLTSNERGSWPALVKLGPDALDPQLNAKWFQVQLQVRKAPIKAVLLDQQVMAGLGNIYVDEALHKSGIHPLAPAQNIPLAKLTMLLKEIRAVLKASIRYQGTTFRDYRTAKGEKGGFFERLLVYGQTGKLCRSCRKSKIIKIRVAQRGTHVCERCQVR